jgi:putative oxidoreductase
LTAVPSIASYGPAAHAFLRIAIGILFLQHGLQKLFGMFGGIDGAGGNVPLASQIGLAGILETGGGILLILGLFVRPTAALLVIEMLVAYSTVHFPQGGWPIQNGGELALLYGSLFVFFAVQGAGPYSLDDRIRAARRAG